jgi:hypothetical protein
MTHSRDVRKSFILLEVNLVFDYEASTLQRQLDARALLLFSP